MSLVYASKVKKIDMMIKKTVYTKIKKVDRGLTRATKT